MAYTDYLPEWEDLWAKSEMSPEKFFRLAVEAGRLDILEYEREVSELGMVPYIGWYFAGREYEIPGIEIPPAYIEPGEVAGPPPPDYLESKIVGYFRDAFHEVLVSLWRWVLDQFKNLIKLVVGTLGPPLTELWENAKKVLTESAVKIYEGAENLFEGHETLVPEDAPKIAGKLYAMAWGAGMLAHGISAVTELAHPLKSMGIHQTAAMVSDFGQFSRIAGATMGPLVNGVLGRLMTYNFQNLYRPQIPDEKLLIEFRSKREISKPEFDEAMGYQGFSKPWIDVIERWQWKDPRMFEIIRLADIGLQQGTMPSEEREWFKEFGLPGIPDSDWWLQRKFMRAGYEDVDIPVMIRFIHRREISFALTYVRTAIRRNYRWGYMGDEELEKWMKRLQLPDEAKQWISDAGELDREYFYKQDMVRYYTTAFRNDVIDDDEFLVSLLAIGLPVRESDIAVRTEKVKKKPKPSQPVTTAAKKATTKVQAKYIQLYREQYRKGLITRDRYLESLLSIGLTADLAEVSVQLEEAKLTSAVPE